MKYVVGTDIGGTTVKLGIFTVDGEVLDKWEIPTDRSERGANVPKDVAEAILGKLAELKIDKNDVKGIGMGIPGPVTSDGVVHKCSNLGWGIVDVRTMMNELTGLDIYAGNDANVAALGEMWKGGGQGYKDIVMVTLGTGVGAGVIVNGKIITGAKGGAGEIGHITVNESETRICGCGGHGHLEQYASATGIKYLADEMVANDKRETSLRGVANITAKDVFDHAKAGDALALELVDKICHILADALKAAACTINPEAFVIGGGVSKAGKIITDTVAKYFVLNLQHPTEETDFCLATLGNDAGIYGAAKMAIDGE